ncbi:MAG: PLP-dependent cysteine synthase family protein [Candidatus Heimdallarchaeota archaeon]
MRYANKMLQLIGNTSLLKLNKVAKDLEASVFVKLELMNPSGSYKDRMALAMVEAAEQGLTWNRKKLKPGGIVCDASSGNTAPALAFVCGVKGLKSKIGIYKPMVRKDDIRLKITRIYGADVFECPHPTEYFSENVWRKLSEDEKNLSWVIAGKKYMEELEKSNPDAVWVDQIYNKYNYIGQMKMGDEIYNQLEGKIDAWGCSIGSGGTLLGVANALKENGEQPWVFGVVPSTSEVYLELDKGETKKGEFRLSSAKQKIVELMDLKKWQTEKSIVEEMLKIGYPDELFRVSDKDARDMANRLAREEGIWCGMSSGANVTAALKVAERMKDGQNVVTVIVDRRDRYLGEYPNEIYVV